jgi:DNA-binding MarR family transcriptional regulator
MSRNRAALLKEMDEVTRDSAGRALALHQAIADRFGLGPSDLKCLDLARAEKDLTAGRLAEVTGLSSSAVTSLLDRLERAGFIERVRRAQDRRKVYVRSTGRHEAAVGAVFAQVGQAFGEIMTGYTDDQIEVVVEILSKLNVTSASLVRSLGAGEVTHRPL